jgi:hypothetical protein
MDWKDGALVSGITGKYEVTSYLPVIPLTNAPSFQSIDFIFTQSFMDFSISAFTNIKYWGFYNADVS